MGPQVRGEADASAAVLRAAGEVQLAVHAQSEQLSGTVLSRQVRGRRAADARAALGLRNRIALALAPSSRHSSTHSVDRIKTALQYTMSAAQTPPATSPAETKSDEEAASESPPASRLISPLPSRAKQNGTHVNPAVVQPPSGSLAIQSNGAQASPSLASSSLPGPSHAPARAPFDIFDFSHPGDSDEDAIALGARHSPPHKETAAAPPPPRALIGNSVRARLADLGYRVRRLQRQVDDLEYERDKLEAKTRALQRKLAKMKRDLRIARRGQ